MRRLKDLLDLVAAAESEGNSEDLGRMKLVLSGDLRAEEAGFPAVVVAPDDNAARALASAVVATGTDGVPVVLPSFRSVETWPGEAFLAVERARIVAVSTTAQQLVPRVLGDVLQHAGRLGIPVQVYVTGLKRARDPFAVARAAPGHVAGSTRGASLRVTCVGDERFQGPSLQAAVMADAGAFGGVDETRQKCAQRVCRSRLPTVRDLLVNLSAGIQESQSQIREESNLLRETEKGLSILARAESRACAGELVGVRDELLRIEAKTLCEKAQRAASAREDRSPIAALTEVLQDEVSKAIRRGRKMVGPRLDQRHALLASRVESDYSRASAALRSVVNLPDGASGSKSELLLEGLKADLNTAFGELESASRELVAPDGLMTRMVEWLRQSRKKGGSNSAEAGGNGEESPAHVARNSRRRKSSQTEKVPGVHGSNSMHGEATGDPVKPDDSMENEGIPGLRDMADRLEPWLQGASSMQLESETERILSDVATRIDAQRQAISMRWEEQVQDHITVRFLSLHEAIAQARSTLDTRLCRVAAIEAQLDD